MTDPDVNLSLHPARATRKKAVAFQQDKEFIQLPVDSIRMWVTCSLRSTGNYPASSLLRSSAPLAVLGTFGLMGLPLVPFPLASPTRFSSSVRKPGLESRLLYTGHRTASK